MTNPLHAGYQHFQRNYTLQSTSLLAQLAEGQSPHTAIISCCDSRVDPLVIFNAQLGELFTIRTVANLVTPYDENGAPNATASALEYAVKHLNVPNITVLGHSSCGGIKALMETENTQNLTSDIGKWINTALPAKEAVLKRHPKSPCAACEQMSIAHSLKNLMTYSWIKERVEAGTLHLHGLYYTLAKAELTQLNPKTGVFEPFTA